MAKAQRKEEESPVTWLEGELRETKARLHKVESELDQALKQVWSMGADVRRLSESLSVSGSSAATLSTVREELRQVHGQVSKLLDRHATLAHRTDEVVRQRQAEGGREAQDMAALTKQIDAASRGVQQFENRMQALEEVARHSEEGVAGERLVGQTLERHLEDLANRLSRTHEATLRLDQETTRAAAELERLDKVDAVIDERTSLVIEQAKRAGERIDKLERVAEFPEEARELLKRANFEREQLSLRLVAIEKIATEVSERTQEFVQGLARLDHRSQAQGAQLVELAGQLRDLSDHTRSQLKWTFQILLRQRRRQLETLSQEIKELSQGELHSAD